MCWWLIVSDFVSHLFKIDWNNMNTLKREKRNLQRCYHWNKICFKFTDDLDKRTDIDKSDGCCHINCNLYCFHFLSRTSNNKVQGGFGFSLKKTRYLLIKYRHRHIYWRIVTVEFDSVNTSVLPETKTNNTTANINYFIG